MPKKQPDMLEAAKRREAVHRLVLDLQIALGVRDEVQTAQDPFEASFRAAHERLLRKTTVEFSTRAERLRFYDLRLRAGHEWHPHRQRLRDTNRWIEEIQRELKKYE
jgi:hypothetical protein